MKELPEIRFWRKVEVGSWDRCWPWTGAVGSGGYGNFWDGERYLNAHRFAFASGRDVVMPQVVMHQCDNRACCNPHHLAAGTHADNVRDKHAKGREARGSTHGNSVLTEAEVAAIREMVSDGGLTHAEAAREFGVTRECVSRIIRREVWVHV